MYTRNDLGLALLAPFRHFGVDLIPYLWLDFTRVASEQSRETLRSTVDNIYLVQRHRMHDLPTFLYFIFQALNAFSLQIVSQSNDLAEEMEYTSAPVAS